MSFLPLNSGSLVLLAINGNLISTPPTETVNLYDVISVKPGVIQNATGANVNTVRMIAKGITTSPDVYDFALSGEGDASATAGFTAASTATAGDKVVVTVDGVTFTYTCAGGETPSALRTAVGALLDANTQGFTETSTLTGSAVLYTLHAPAGSTSYWNGKVVNVTFPTNTGPTFSTAVHTNFTGGVGVAEQFLAFLTAQSLTSTLLKFTGLLFDNTTPKENGPSILLDSKYVVKKTLTGSTNTQIIFQAPLLVLNELVVAGDQTA